MKLAGRALSFILTELDQAKVVDSFTLFKTSDFASRMAKEFPAFVAKAKPPPQVLQGDVKKMYTNVDHSMLFKTLEWVFDLVKTHLPSKDGILVRLGRS